MHTNKMSKFSSVLFLIGLLFIATQGAPLDQSDFTQLANGNWDAFQKLFNQNFNFQPDFESIKNLQPQGPDSHVYGEGEYRFHSSSNINGQTSERSGGRRVVNRDGKVQDYQL